MRLSLDDLMIEIEDLADLKLDWSISRLGDSHVVMLDQSNLTKIVMAFQRMQESNRKEGSK